MNKKTVLTVLFLTSFFAISTAFANDIDIKKYLKMLWLLPKNNNIKNNLRKITTA